MPNNRYIHTPNAKDFENLTTFSKQGFKSRQVDLEAAQRQGTSVEFHKRSQYTRRSMEDLHSNVQIKPVVCKIEPSPEKALQKCMSDQEVKQCAPSLLSHKIEELQSQKEKDGVADDSIHKAMLSTNLTNMGKTRDVITDKISKQELNFSCQSEISKIKQDFEDYKQDKTEYIENLKTELEKIFREKEKLKEENFDLKVAQQANREKIDRCLKTNESQISGNSFSPPVRSKENSPQALLFQAQYASPNLSDIKTWVSDELSRLCITEDDDIEKELIHDVERSHPLFPAIRILQKLSNK